MKRISIIGGGASGVFLGLLLSSKDYQVTIFEKDDRPLKKLMATGNGRCNFTNENLDLSFYRGPNKKFLQDILEDFNNEDVIEYFRSLGMYETSLESGRVYPYTMAAKTLNNVLLNNLKDKIDLRLECEIVDLKKKKDIFYLVDDKKKIYQADGVVLATGGLRTIRKNDYSKGYDLAAGFGHEKTELFPGIVQLKLREVQEAKRMKNIKFNALVSLYADGQIVESYEGDTLFADYGISGLSILQLSNEVLYRLKDQDVVLSLDLFPQVDQKDLEDILRRKINSQLSLLEAMEGMVQDKIAIELAQRAGVNPFIKAKSLREEEIKSLAKVAKAFTFRPLGPKSKDDGQITCGGLDLDQLTEKLESKKVKNLYFTGEVLDVQGDSGGYNLQWAWSSAHRVYRSITGEE